MKIALFAHFKEYHGNHTRFKSLYDFRGRCLKIRDVCMDFESYFKVHSLSFFTLKVAYLVKWPISTCTDCEPYFKVHNLVSVYRKSFHVVVSVYRFVKIWNLPRFPAEFRNDQFRWTLLITNDKVRREGVWNWITLCSFENFKQWRWYFEGKKYLRTCFLWERNTRWLYIM